MAIIDNTLAADVDTFNPATPLAQAAKLQAFQVEQQQQQFKLAQAELGAEARGLQAFVNTPEFPAKWAETTDRLLQKGLLDPQSHAQWRNTPSPLMLKSIISRTEDPTLSFRKQEAVREQGNTDREFTATQDYRKQVLAKDDPVQKASARERLAEQQGLERGTPEFKAYVLNGELPTTSTTITAQVEQRRQAAARLGITPESPSYESFVLTGKMPREDAQPLTATDKKAILEADEAVMSNQAGIDSLGRAIKLSEKAFEGPTAGGRGYLASFLGEDSDWGKGGVATENLTNEVMSNALSQMKAIFGGNPTEGERAILLELQGSVTKPHAVRKEIYERAIKLAERRLQFNKEKAEQLRGKTYYKPQGGTRATAPTKEIPAEAILALKANPALKADFEAKYGAGTAASVLK